MAFPPPKNSGPIMGPQMGPKPSKGPNPNFQASAPSISGPGSAKKAPGKKAFGGKKAPPFGKK